MKPAEFDEIAAEYNDEIVKNAGMFGRFRQSMLSYKSQYLAYLLPQKPERILDYGCGIGMNIPYLQKYFPGAKIYGCDISEESIRIASEHNTNSEFNVIKSVEDLKIYANKIDCVFISTVLHHIPPAEHKNWLRGLYEILKRDGCLIVFEHNMKNPLMKGLVKKTPMDKDAVMLDMDYCKSLIKDVFGETSWIKTGYTWFFPWRNKVCTAIEHRLKYLPLGAQYYVAAKK
jgi:ubiquinone/menaquinone biosynthesis C-methylase UbiE